MTYSEVMERCIQEGGLRATLPDEKAAYDFRARCYAWRRRQQKQGETRYDTIVIRKARGAAELTFETGNATVELTSLDGKPLSHETETPSLEDLLKDLDI